MDSLEGLIIYGASQDEVSPAMEQGRACLEGKILDSFYAPHSDLRSAHFMSELHDMQFAFLEDMKVQETQPEFLKSVATRKVTHTTYVGLKRSDTCQKTYMSILQFYEPYKHNKTLNLSEKYATCKLIPKALILCMSSPHFKLGRCVPLYLRQILTLIHEKVFLSGILNYIKACGIQQSSPFSYDEQESSSISASSLKVEKYTPLDVKHCKASIEFYLSLIFHYFTSDWGNQHIVNVIHSSDLTEPFLQFTSAPPTSHYLSQAEHTSLSKLTAPPFLLSAGSLKELFTLVPLDHLLELFRGLLLEQNILLIQSNYGKLGELMQQLLSLIRPLEFIPHAVRAFLTPGSLFLLQTALPALLGIARSFWNCRTQSGLDCNLIYDVDEKTFLHKNLNVSKLCTDARLPNLDILRGSIAEVTGERERWIKEQDQCETYEEREELWWIYFSLKIRQAFFNYLLLLVNNYMEFFDKQPKRDPRRPLKVDLQFDPETYLSVAPRSVKEFLKGVIDTNDFQYFLEKTYNVMHQSQGTVDPYVLSFTKAVVRLRSEGGLTKSGLKEDQDRQIRELIARCKRPVLISFDEFTKAYCDRLYSRRQLNETSFTDSEVDSSDSFDPVYSPVERIHREKLLQIRCDNYEEILRKSKELETSELMRHMKQMLNQRLKEAERHQHKCHKRGPSKQRAHEKYRAAWQRLEEEVKQKKSELITSVPEVNESSEVGDSHFLHTQTSEVDISFKDARGAQVPTDEETTKPSSTPYSSIHLKAAKDYRSVPISTPHEAIHSKVANVLRAWENPGGASPLLTTSSGGETPLVGTWVGRDKTTLGTTQKKVVYAEEEHLVGYKKEVHRLNSSRRLDFVAEEKRNIRGNTTTGAKQPQLRGVGFGRALFQDARKEGGKANQENVNSGNFTEERELLRHARTQISKYDQRLQDFSPYKPEYFAQRKIIQERIRNGNHKAFKKLFSDKSNAFYPIDCDSLVSKYMPRPLSGQKLRVTAQLREKIDFGMFKHNKAGINTNSGAFSHFKVGASMTARNRDLISPSRKTGQHFLFKSANVLSPGPIKVGARTPQVEPGAGLTKERSHIATPKVSMGSMKHSMSSMNTPTGSLRKYSGKVLFKGFTNEIADSQSQLASAVRRPVPGYKTCVSKGEAATPMGVLTQSKVGRVGPCTLGASIGSKMSTGSGVVLRSAFKPQASRKLFQSGQSAGRESGQERGLHGKYISSFTKTPFDKAAIHEIGGWRPGAFQSPHDEVKKELNFNKNSLR